VERRSDLRELVDDLGRLPEDQRAALVMSEIEELGHDEVAQVLGCRRDKVRALVYQARSSLSGWREACALPCREVRQELAVARGPALRRGHLRRHLNLCSECAVFRENLDRQRRGLAVVLPVLPTLGLKERVLDAAWGAAGAGSGAAAGGAGAGGGLAGSLGPTAIKIGAAVLAIGAGVGTLAGLGGSGGGDAPSGPPAWERSAASERPDVGLDRARDPHSAVARLRAREQERIASASPEATAPEQEAPAGPQAPETGSPPAETAPPSAPAPTQDRGTLPEVDVEVEVEVDPLAPLP